MASKFIIKVTAVALALCFAVFPHPARAVSSADLMPTNEHVLKFYLDPALVPNLEFAKTVLPKYVSDMNTVLAKNTTRRLVFNPEIDIILTSNQPQTNSAASPLPTQDFEIWAHARRTDWQTSYGGYGSVDRSGAAVLAGLYWTRLYDPENLATNTVLDYSTQISNMLHELGHVFGAGIGEYYNLASITDTTGVAPFLNINLNDPGDAFWSNKPDFMTDPLLRLTRVATRAEYLAVVRYSDLTAAIINGEYRNGIPSFDHSTIQVLDENGEPVIEANIKVWNVVGTSPYPSELLFDGMTDENGQIILTWGDSRYSHNSSNFVRLIKVYKNGVSLTTPRYVSIFDADIAKLVSHADMHTVILNVTTNQPGENNTVLETIASTGTNDGWTLESSETSNLGNSMNVEAKTFLLGDDAANRQYRSILHFDTSSLPDNAIFTKVTLKIKMQGRVGTNPFNTHKNIVIDIQKGTFNTANLQPSDFQRAAGKKAIAMIENTSVDNWFYVELDAMSYSSINLTGTTQFRLRFQRDDNNDFGADYIKFFSGNALAASVPLLIIEYQVP